MPSIIKSLVLGLGWLTWIGVACGAEPSGQERAEAAGHVLIGAPAPRIEVKTIDGDTIDLGALYGKRAVYLKFWATWCTPCRQQMPHFEHVYETAGPDLAVIGVNAGFNDSIEEIQRYRKRLGITMPMVFDGDGRLGAAFHLRVTPQHIIIGRDGRVLYVGHLADARLDAALLEARSAARRQGPARTAAAASGTASQDARLSVGDPLPDVSVKTLAGQSFPLHSRSPHERTVLVFLSPWCESYLATTRPTVSAQCRDARERIEALNSDREVRWLGVASGLWASPGDLREYRTKYQVTIPLTLDESGTLFREFGVSNTPTVIVADGNGRLVRRIDADSLDTLPQVLQSP